MRISDAPGAAPTPDVAAVGSAAQDSKPASVPGSVQDEVAVRPIAVAASNSLTASEARITELREKVLDGTYNVDPVALSARIVDESLEK